MENTITVSVIAKSPTSMTRIAGYNSFPVSVTAAGIRGSGNLEIALVLDNTGSMSGSKITNLKAAANDLVTSLFREADPAKPNALKIGIVPFSMTVNVGPSNATQSWLDKDAKASYHSDIFVSSANRLTLFRQMGVAWGGCVESSQRPTTFKIPPPSIANPNTCSCPSSHPDESDKDRNAVNDYMSDYTTTSTVADHRTRQARSQNIPGIPSYKRAGSATPSPYRYGPNSGCELQPITRLTTSQSTLTNAINAMTIVGDTNIAMGLVWGWHLLSPNGPFAEGVPYDEKNTRKFVILMTDGQKRLLCQLGRECIDLFWPRLQLAESYVDQWPTRPRPGRRP